MNSSRQIEAKDTELANLRLEKEIMEAALKKKIEEMMAQIRQQEEEKAQIREQPQTIDTTKFHFSSQEAANQPPIVEGFIIAGTRYKYFKGHDHMSDDYKDEWAITKETTVAGLVRVFSRFVTEKIEIHKNLNVKQFQDLFKRIKPRINGRKKIYLIAYTGHGC